MIFLTVYVIQIYVVKFKALCKLRPCARELLFSNLNNISTQRLLYLIGRVAIRCGCSVMMQLF